MTLYRDFILSKDLYNDQLTTIGGVHFTHREIDVLSCITLKQNIKGTVNFLSAKTKPISIKSVDTHISNIKRKLITSEYKDITTFIQQSGALQLLNNYHNNLFMEHEFLLCVEELKHSVGDNINIANLILYSICAEDQHREFSAAPRFTHYLTKHLRLLITNVTSEMVPHCQDLPLLSSKSLEDNNYIVCVFPDKASSITYDPAQIQSQQLLSTGQYKKNLLLIFEDISCYNSLLSLPYFQNCSYVECIKYTSYYDLFFSVLCNVFKDQIEIIESIKDSFVEKCQLNRAKFDYNLSSILSLKCLPLEDNNKAIGRSEKHNSQKQQKHFQSYSPLKLAILLLLIGCFALCTHYFLVNKTAPVTRSDLSIPSKSALLHRPELIKEIDQYFSKATYTKTVALVGISGAGKTILARQYAALQTQGIVWELYAKDKSSLQKSLIDLALELSKNCKDENLSSIITMNDTAIRERRLIKFIKDKLRDTPNWLLIYDNVTDLNEIQQYIFKDEITCGSGKIIITTNNNLVANHVQIDHTVYIGELSPYQKLCLFTNINNKASHQKQKNNGDISKIQAFLEHVPPFPVDVSVAAYYINATHTSYDDYLKLLENPANPNSQEIQNNISSSALGYTKSRNSIIQLSLQELVNTNKKFVDLLQLVGLISSQDIPKALLIKIVDTNTVDDFLSNLQRYSFFCSNAGYSRTSFSIHQSIHDCIVSFCKNNVFQSNKSFASKNIVSAFEDYAATILNARDITQMKALSTHINRILTHAALTPPQKSALYGLLGLLDYYLGNDEQAEHLLNNYLTYLHQDSRKNYHKIATTSMILGNLYKLHDNYTKAIELLQDSISTCDKIHDNTTQAEALGYLGSIYRKMGDLALAIETINKSIVMCRSVGSKIGEARALRYLGMVYYDLDKYSDAILSLKNSISLYKIEHKNRVGMATALIYLGLASAQNSDMNKAKKALQEGIDIYKETYGEDSKQYIWAANQLTKIK